MTFTDAIFDMINDYLVDPDLLTYHADDASLASMTISELIDDIDAHYAAADALDIAADPLTDFLIMNRDALYDYLLAAIRIRRAAARA